MSKLHFIKKRKSSHKISKNIIYSFKYALRGIIYCFQFEKNFRIQIVFAIAAFFLAIIFNLRIYEYIIISSTIFSVLILELINTSIESIADLIVERKFSNLVKISKDCSAGAVFLASINSIIVASYIFIPKIKLLIQNL